MTTAISKTSLRAALLALTFLGCGGSSAPVAPAAPAPTPTDSNGSALPTAATAAPARKLIADTEVTTDSKATFTAPAAWTLSQSPGRITLTEPDGEAQVWLVEINGAANAAAAIDAAWGKLRQGGVGLPVAVSEVFPAADGWQERVQTVYVTPTAESRTVLALARRFGDTWYLVLVDGKNGALDRRGAQLGAVIESFRVPTMEKESFAGKKANALDAARLAAFAEFIESARIESGIPGAAVAVVSGGKIVFERGFGVRELGKPAKVTPSTRFMIGSTTKSLTTLMMARLVDAKKLAWTSPVAQLAPSFALGDEAATKALTLQHTVCACTGMPRRDLEFIFEFAGVTPEARLASMKTMKPTTGFGETFQYSNLMVAAGGYIAAQVAKKGPFDKSYEATMKAEVFGPLGMKSTSLTSKAAITGEHARPHGRGLSMSYEKLPLGIEGAVEAVSPAGAAWSTVRDLARYAALELGEGTLDGKRLVSEENLLARRAPQVKISDTSSYGLGLFVDSDRGVQVVHHGGNTLGFTSDLFVLPEHDLGVVLLTNAGGGNAFRRAVRRRFLEIIFDGEPTAQTLMTAAHARAKQAIDEVVALIKPTPDPAWMGKLVGKYHNADLGDLEVRKQGDTYILDVGEWKSPATQEVDLDKTEKLILTGAPFAGFDVVPREENGKTVLVLDGGQLKYVFAPVAR
jgi:CubicO group peptidase (beta-lactamase class C family)